MSVMNDEARRLIAAEMTEKELLGWVATSARLLGFDCVYHTLNSVGSEAGFPDLVMVRGERILFVELKSTRGKVTAPQRRWLDALGATGKVEVYCWRPSDLDVILECLRGAP